MWVVWSLSAGWQILGKVLTCIDEPTLTTAWYMLKDCSDKFQIVEFLHFASFDS